MTEPAHLAKARQYIGFHERPGNRGIEEFIGGAKTGRVGDSWCAIFVNFCLETSGSRGTRSALARSFERDANFVRLIEPRLGCVVTFWRGSPTSGQGHVGFYAGEGTKPNTIRLLSGNDDDEVREDEDRSLAQHTGYWWPKALIEGPQQAPRRFTDITATVFADPTVAYSDVRPGWNDRPGVALPFFFRGGRPKVRVTYRGKSVVCEIIDQGPWNFTDKSRGLAGDPYWETGTRPQAESGIDLTGRPTNKAGIDLTPAAADAIGLPGKGLVDWEFVTDQPETTVTEDERWEKLERLLTNLDARLQHLEQVGLPALPPPAQPAPEPPPSPPPTPEPPQPTTFGTLFANLFPGIGGPANASILGGGAAGLALPFLQMLGQVTPGSGASTTIGTLAAGLIGGGTLGRISTGINLLTSILGAVRARNPKG